MKKTIRPLPLALLLLALGGCSSDGLDDLRTFTTNAHKDKKPRVEPPPEVKSYPKVKYSAMKLRDPFSVANLAPASIVGGQGENDPNAPDPTRIKEPLEEYPLDTLAMVGTLTRGKQRWAVIKVQSGIGELHRVRIGEYLGRNHGRIIRITDSQITLVEIYRNPVGRWVEREAILQIQK